MRVLREGDTCWRIARADRWAFIVDGNAYFRALAASLDRCAASFRLVAWDFDDRVILRGASGPPRRIGRLLAGLARSGRRVDVLAWSWHPVMGTARRWFPSLRLRWLHHRVRYVQLAHPLRGGSHHQKLALVDEQLAFLGGLDLALERWDTRLHEGRSRRRISELGRSYDPFHDVMVAFDGEAASAVTELVRSRFRMAGASLAPGRAAACPWPAHLVPHLRDVRVGIARTEPRLRAFEIERLYVEAIRSARRRIFIENQYLSSRCIGLELAKRLAEDKGPEVVIVAPAKSPNVIERLSMGVLRDRWAAWLRGTDVHGRLRILTPYAGDRPIFVHSKVMVIDEELAIVGSANLNDRSLRLDTESVAAIEAEGDGKIELAIRGFRDGLVAEHLGTTRERVERALALGTPLVEVIDRLRNGQGRLRPLEPETPVWLAVCMPPERAIDPPGPMFSTCTNLAYIGHSLLRAVWAWLRARRPARWRGGTRR